MVDRSCMKLGTLSCTGTRKRKNHSLHNLQSGHTIVNHFSCSVKKQKLEKVDIFLMKNLCELNGLDDLDKTTDSGEENDSDVEIIGESYYFNIDEDFPTNVSKKSERFRDDSDVEIIGESYYFNIDEDFPTNISKKSERFRNDPDVEVIDEMYDFDIGGSQINCGKKNHKTDNIMEAVKYGNVSNMGVVYDSVRIKQPDYRSVWKPKFGKRGQEFTAEVVYEPSSMSVESFSVLECDKMNIKEINACVKMTDIEDACLYHTDMNIVNENSINNAGSKKLKTLKSSYTKKVLMESNGMTTEISKNALNDVRKASYKKYCDFPFRENCQKILGENRHLRLECNKNILSKTVSYGTSNNDNKCNAVNKKETFLSSENNSSISSTETNIHCDNNGETENKYLCKQLSSPNDHNQAFYGATMQHLIENNHDCAYRRLNVMFPSSCALQPYTCYKCHHKPKKSSMNENMCEYHFGEGEWDEAVEVLEHLVSKTTCPDWKLVVYLLGHMCETDDVEYLNTCSEIISSLLSCHPPCYLPSYYLKIFTQAVELQSLRNGGISKDGIFRDILFNLQQFVKSRKFSEEYVCDSEESFVSTSNIDSQCLVMELMVDILEGELCVWLPKRGFNPRNVLLMYVNCPLIVKLLWCNTKQDGLERFNDIKVFKPIIDLYVLSFHKDVPLKLMHIASRLLTLIAEVMRACDFEENATYPHFGNHSRKLAHTVYVSIAAQPVSMIQKMIQGLSPSWLEMLVCCSCMSSFTTNCITLQRLEFVTNCKKVVEHQSKHRSLARINAKGETRLHVLCRNKRLKELEELLSDPTVDVNVADHAGWTPLHETVFKGNIKNLETLVMYRPPGSMGGVDLRAPGYAGKTPLMEAAEEGHIAICELLLKYGGAMLLEDTQENGKTVWDLPISENVRSVLAQYASSFENDTVSRTTPSHNVVFKCAPTQEFWNLLSFFTYSYMDTFMLKGLLYYQSSGCSTLLENRDGKARLKFDGDRLAADVAVLEEVLKFFMSCKSGALMSGNKKGHQ